MGNEDDGKLAVIASNYSVVARMIDSIVAHRADKGGGLAASSLEPCSRTRDDLSENEHVNA